MRVSPGVAFCLLLCAVVALVVRPCPALAQTADPHAAQPERPTVATHAFVVAPGYVELESGLQRTPIGAGVMQWTMPTVVKIGLLKNLQLDVAPQWVRNAGEDGCHAGIGDTTVGVKWHATDGAALVGSLALQASVTLPSGSSSQGTGTGTTAANFLVISSHVIHDVSLDLNIGYTRRSGNGEQAPRDATLWTVASGIPVAGHLGLSLELFGYPATRGPAATPAQVGLTVGPTWTVRRSLVLDGGAILNVRGFEGAATYVGMTWNIGKAWTAR